MSFIKTLVLLILLSSLIFGSLFWSAVQINKSTKNNTASNGSSSNISPPEDHLKIPKLNIEAPVNYSTGLEEEEIIKNLQEGVVFYNDSDLPNELGVSIYFGHSSNYWWSQGEYDQVFRYINKLTKGDKIYIYYDGQEYVYKTTDYKIINKKDWSSLTNTPVKNSLVLVTCWPPQTTWKRYAVWAEKD